MPGSWPLLLLSFLLTSSSSEVTVVAMPKLVSRQSLGLRASKDIPPQGFFNPLDQGGNMLTLNFPTSPEGLGEPLNAVISANSDSDVMVDQQINGGLHNYFESFGFSSECLGQHLGDHQQANLGDGNGALNETAVIRYDYGDPALGTCKESVQGGDHFRYWVQSGPKANSGAVFMAVSYEKPAIDGHDIIFDGYNLGRDWLVGNITGSAISTDKLTNSSTFSGTTSANGYTYSTNIEYVGGLLKNSSIGVNHFLTVGGGPNNITAIDGLIAVLTVRITDRPKASAALPTTSNALTFFTRTSIVIFFSLFVAFV